MVEFPDVEEAVTGFLRERMPGVGFGTTTRGDYDAPTPFVLVHRIGGYMSWPALDYATVDVECWGPSREAAHDTAQRVNALMMGTRLRASPFARVSVTSGLMFLPDDVTGISRWLMTFQVAVRPIKRGGTHGA
ncbi:hypothetical protein [Microtetraspora malaysiensis]|uniref:hypothetical protein n=1 Tax=Microtetraspora malaysiensis TaxID=161358 RepID=UPI003D8A3ADC